MSQASETALSHSMGQCGFKYLSTAGTATYNSATMVVIQVLQDSTISCTAVRGDSLTSVACLAGTEIVGEFTSVTVAGLGGAALVYLARR